MSTQDYKLPSFLTCTALHMSEELKCNAKAPASGVQRVCWREQVVAACYCGKGSTERRCAASGWSCRKLCGRRLPCGHRCPTLCHPGACKGCSLSGAAPLLPTPCHAARGAHTCKTVIVRRALLFHRSPFIRSQPVCRRQRHSATTCRRHRATNKGLMRGRLLLLRVQASTAAHAGL